MFSSLYRRRQDYFDRSGGIYLPTPQHYIALKYDRTSQNSFHKLNISLPPSMICIIKSTQKTAIVSQVPKIVAFRCSVQQGHQRSPYQHLQNSSPSADRTHESRGPHSPAHTCKEVTVSNACGYRMQSITYILYPDLFI